MLNHITMQEWRRESNPRPHCYEPRELPNCSTPLWSTKNWWTKKVEYRPLPCLDKRNTPFIENGAGSGNRTRIVSLEG